MDELRLENRWLTERTAQMRLVYEKQLETRRNTEKNQTWFLFKRMFRLVKNTASQQFCKEQSAALRDLCQCFAQLAEKLQSDDLLLEEQVEKLQQELEMI